MALEFRLPDIGEGIDEAELLDWHVAVGDEVVEDQPLCDVQTDKAMVTLPCPGTGTILELCATPGEAVPVGGMLVRIEVDQASESGQASGSAAGPAQRPLAAPATRRLAREAGVDLASIAGSGLQGRITRADVEAARGTVAAPAGQTQGDEVVALTGVRRAIARTLTQAWQTIPHMTDYREVDATGLIQARRALRAHADREGDADLAKALTVTPIVVKICATVLRRHRYVNASIDLEREEILLRGAINVGIAVAAPDGLLVPVVHDADRKSIRDLAVEIAALGAAARIRSLTPAQLSGATFTVNNYGALGIWLGTPIIAPPQVANFGIGRIEERPVAREGEVVIRPVAPVAVSGDHRVLDGHTLAAFVSDVVALMADPGALLGELR